MRPNPKHQCVSCMLRVGMPLRWAVKRTGVSAKVCRVIRDQINAKTWTKPKSKVWNLEEQIIGMHKAGKGTKIIMRELGLPKTSVRRVLRKHQRPKLPSPPPPIQIVPLEVKAERIIIAHYRQEAAAAHRHDWSMHKAVAAYWAVKDYHARRFYHLQRAREKHHYASSKITRRYIVKLLCHKSTLRAKDIPAELIQIKQLYIQLHRQIRNINQQQTNIGI